MTPRSRSIHALAAVGCALAFAASGCGGDDTDDSGGGSSQAAPASTAGGAVASVDGKDVFESNCSSCHTLSDADASGSFGPNLDELKPDAEEVSSQVKAGGGGMPAFDGKLSPEEIQAVADYVSTNAGK